MSDFARGLILGTISTFAIWQIDDHTNLAWWVGILTALGAGFVIGIVWSFASHLISNAREPHRHPKESQP